MQLFTRNILKVGGGTALGQFLAVATTPLVTRLYTPSDMGLLGIFMAFVGIAGVGVSLRYEMPIVSIADDLEADCLLIASLAVAVPVSLAAGLLFYLMIRFDILSYHLLPAWSSALVVLTLIATATFTSLRYWFVRHGDFDVVGRAIVLQGAGRAAIPLAAGFTQVGWVGLLLGEVGSRIFGVSRMIAGSWPSIRKSLPLLSRGYFASVLLRNWKYPALLLPSSLIDALAAMLPVPMVAHLFGTGLAGEFFLVQRLCNLPAGLIAASVADVFHASAATAHRDNPEEIATLTRSVTGKLMLVSLPVYGALALLAPFACGRILGPQWEVAGTYLAIIAPVSIAATVVSPLSRLLLVVDKMQIKLVFDAASLAVPFVSFCGMHYAGFGFQAALMVYAVLQVGAYGIYYAMIRRASRGSMEVYCEA